MPCMNQTQHATMAHPRWRARRGRLDRPMLPVGVIEAQELKTYMAVRCPSIDVTIT